MFDEKDLVLVVIDLQDRLLKVISEREKLISNITILIEFFKKIKAPIIITKQVKLGEITGEVTSSINNYRYKWVIEKETFSCFGDEEFKKIINELNRKTIILTGIETHICILQTAIDALNNGFRVVIPYDAVTSQIRDDHLYALKYLGSKGVEIMPSETIIYATIKTPSHPSFKEILNLVKDRRRKYSV
jgi:nicotinamidase-related amidase